VVASLLAELLIREECSRLGLSAEVACVIHVGSPAPSVHFDIGTLEAVARLGAEIDLDLYIDASALKI
jgi:hypothetical protein